MKKKTKQTISDDKTVVYVAGPVLGKLASTSNPSHWKITQNCRRAEETALEIWKMGAVAVCPHLNTLNFQFELPNEVWYEGDLELVRRSDAVFLCPGWEESVGSLGEKAEAESLGIPVFTDLPTFFAWLCERHP